EKRNSVGRFEGGPISVSGRQRECRMPPESTQTSTPETRSRSDSAGEAGAAGRSAETGEGSGGVRTATESASRSEAQACARTNHASDRPRFRKRSTYRYSPRGEVHYVYALCCSSGVSTSES